MRTNCYAGRTLFAIIWILSIFLNSQCVYAYNLKTDWAEYKSEHFIIYYHSSISNKYIREFTRRCERYYYLIADRLKLRRFDFWTWENRARIFIYQSREEYIQDRGRPEWSGASVESEKKFISTYYFAEDFFNIILPHELTHIVLKELIGFKTQVPLWFNEGTSCANEDDCYLNYLLTAKGFLDEQTYLSVPQMEAMGRPGTNSPNLFYATAGSLIIFLLEEYQKQDFIQLCRELRDGASFYGAMQKVYGITDGADLDEKFLIFLQNKSYQDIATHQGSCFDD